MIFTLFNFVLQIKRYRERQIKVMKNVVFLRDLSYFRSSSDTSQITFKIPIPLRCNSKFRSLHPGLEEWDRKAADILKNQRSMALPTFRSQINHILMKEKNTDFKGYMHELHTVGQAASKRSTIPDGSMNEAAKELHKIKKVCSTFCYIHS